ncbi:MAG TPA: FAD-dependent oxidoreductase [Mobilitalea sp.]|nr:FAD-dependent oxidoreductase [Mobilitalea sp.]
MQTPLNQVMNPTDEERHAILRSMLERAGRPEDYENIINLLAPPPDITNYATPGDLRGMKIGIIGGGLAGMSAAFELRKLGADITILDAEAGRIGGRIFTYYFDPAGRYYGELGAMRIPISHGTTWHYINLFGLNTYSLASPHRNNFLYVHNTRLRTTDSIEEYLYSKYDLTLQERNTPWAELSSYAMEQRLRSLSPVARTELISIKPSYSPEALALMNISLRENFETLGLSQGAINLIAGVQPSNGIIMHISYDEFASEIYSQDFINAYRIENGFVSLPNAFYQSFLSDAPSNYYGISESQLGTVSFKQGHIVTGIYQSDYRNKVVLKYTDTMNATESADIFDYIICSIPFSALRNVEIKPLFSNMKMRAITEYNYVDSYKSLFLCNRRFWEKNAEYGNIIGGISFTDLPIQSIVYPGDHNFCTSTAACSPEEPGVLVASYNLAQNAVRLGGQEEARRYEITRQNVEEVHGLPRGYLNSIVERYQSVHWNSEPNYTGGFALTLAGQKPLFAFEMLKPEFSGRVYFAGEHVSTKHGWMQGALYTGMAAANHLSYHVHGLL